MSRKIKERKQKPVFLIYCAEGKNSQTEKNYFNGIRSDKREDINVKPVNLYDIKKNNDENIIGGSFR